MSKRIFFYGECELDEQDANYWWVLPKGDRVGEWVVFRVDLTKKKKPFVPLFFLTFSTRFSKSIQIQTENSLVSSFLVLVVTGCIVYDYFLPIIPLEGDLPILFTSFSSAPTASILREETVRFHLAWTTIVHNTSYLPLILHIYLLYTNRLSSCLHNFIHSFLWESTCRFTNT